MKLQGNAALSWRGRRWAGRKKVRAPDSVVVNADRTRNLSTPSCGLVSCFSEARTLVLTASICDGAESAPLRPCPRIEER